MSRRESDSRRGNAQGSNFEGLAGVHGKDRRELRKLANYAAVGQAPQSSLGMENMFGQVVKPENDDKSRI